MQLNQHPTTNLLNYNIQTDDGNLNDNDNSNSDHHINGKSDDITTMKEDKITLEDFNKIRENYLSTINSNIASLDLFVRRTLNPTTFNLNPDDEQLISGIDMIDTKQNNQLTGIVTETDSKERQPVKLSSFSIENLIK